MDHDQYFEFVSKALIKQIDITRDWFTYDRETDTYTFPANVWDVMMYERRDFEKTLNTHLATMKVYKDMYEELFGGINETD